MRPFPPGTPFGDAACGGAIQAATVFESSYLPVRLFGVVTAQPVQRYPPRLVSFCNSITLLNAARGPRTSPAKRVVWGEDEQRSERGLPLAAG